MRIGEKPRKRLGKIAIFRPGVPAVAVTLSGRILRGRYSDRPNDSKGSESCGNRDPRDLCRKRIRKVRAWNGVDGPLKRLSDSPASNLKVIL